MRAIRIAVAAGAALLAGCLAACGGLAGTPQGDDVDAPTTSGATGARTPVQLVWAAAEAVEKAGSAKVVVVSVVPGEPETTLQGFAAWKIKSAADLSVAGDYRMPDRMILLDGIVYGLGGLPGVPEGNLGGRHWVKLDPKALEALGRRGAAAAEGVRAVVCWGQQLNPAATLRGLAGAAEITRVGEETLGTADTVRYRATVRPSALPGTADAIVAGHRTGERARPTAGDGSTVTLDLWIDAEGRLLRSVERTRTAKGTRTTSTTYSDYGVEVNIQAPPLADTADMAELIRRHKVS